MNLEKLIKEFKLRNINYQNTNFNRLNDFDNEHLFEYKSFVFAVYIGNEFEAFIDAEKLYKKHMATYERFKRISSTNIIEFCGMVHYHLSSVLM